jgi:hypothetical protein
MTKTLDVTQVINQQPVSRFLFGVLALERLGLPQAIARRSSRSLSSVSWLESACQAHWR